MALEWREGNQLGGCFRLLWRDVGVVYGFEAPGGDLPFVRRLVGCPISIRAMRRRWRIAELATIEGQRAGGESKAISWPVGKDHLKVLLTELPGSRLFV